MKAMNEVKNFCITDICSKYFKFSLKKTAISPFEDNMPNDMRKLFSYYLHHAPNIESVYSTEISAELHKDIFLKMFDGRNYKYENFCASNAVIEKELEKGSLNGESFCCKCKRYVCKKKKGRTGLPQETDLECFLRHIRNAIAHGRVYLYHSGNIIYILFEDINATGNISARIVCNKADLKHWKKVLTENTQQN